MSVITKNGTSALMLSNGASVQTGNYASSPYDSPYYGSYRKPIQAVAHEVGNLSTLTQVVGLVPVYPCDSIECRLGKYGSDDSKFMLPVFAENQTSVWGDYKNDYNSWLFDVPVASALANVSYYLDKQIGGAWVEQTTLIDNTYGFYYPVGTLCDKKYYTGFQILWNKVLNLLGEGIYRFRTKLCTGSFTPSVNHIKFTEKSNGSSIELTTTGFGLIAPTFYLNSSLSLAVNMQNFVTFINTYQDTTYATPLFSATWNAGTGQIDLSGLLGQNCPCSALINSMAITNYASAFSGGANSLLCFGCWASPPFCLKTWDCWAVDQTTRFDAFYSGGVIGNVDKSQSGGTFSFCCSGLPIIYPNKTSLLKMNIRGFPYHVYAPITFTFAMDYGYTLVPPITIAAGTSIISMYNQITNAINTYQATLTPPQFSAYYNGVTTPQYIEITNLFGQNITFTMTADPFVGNNVFWAFIGYITNVPSTNGTNYGTTGQFLGGMNINPQTNGVVPPIKWQDAIRVGGEFGYENTDYERKSIKYQTGVVNKIRDEAILKHTWKSSSLPFWFHERFKVYGLMADKLLVSDYNMNNADYNLKLYSVQGDSSYNPDYKNHPRETMVKCDFKPATQNLKRNRCC